ncbi:hypothetical protein MARPO_0017s0020 [Marchantia polymorpha]|uniref:Pre-mRNA-splicing factor 38 n=1 Tax=Marchantia polymorpha TaxID=3197 RepID=A0A2R6XFL6_MARPO|nr:hypothetical protein MARPO_0017s0020 [Marchantia polymorpha]|eukprot:PTQ44897.1 hypothetical protein MARPO_0017s0020 [Marchantia polymorpha]
MKLLIIETKAARANYLDFVALKRFLSTVGFLYLRYVGDPRSLWGWFEQYVTDEEEFAPGCNGKKTTMGVFVCDLLLDQYYFDTLFPRIPVPVLRQITANLERMKLSVQPAGVTGTGGRHSSDDTARRPPSVKAALSVSFGQRAPHRASTRDSSPIRRCASVSRESRTQLNDQSSLQKKGERVLTGANLASFSRHERDSNRERSGEFDKARERTRQNPRILDTENVRDSERTRDWDRGSHRHTEYYTSKESSRGRDSRINRGYGRYREDSRSRDCEREERWNLDRIEKGICRNQSKLKDRDNGRDNTVGKKWERYYDDKQRSRSRSRSRSPRREKTEVDSLSTRVSPGQAIIPSSNLAKLRNVYGDGSTKNQDAMHDTTDCKSESTDIIRLGGDTWI